MKKIVLLAILSTSIIFTNCKKKKDDPAPAPAATTNPFGTTSGVSDNGKITPLTTKAFSSSGTYILEGTDASNSIYVDASFPKGKPTASSTEDLSKSAATFILEYSTKNADLIATSGTADIVVGDTTITVTFTDASFTDGTTTVKYSGQLIVSTKKTTGGTTGGTTTTSGGSGTVTVNGTASNLSISSASYGSVYSITGIVSGTSNSVLLGFYSGKPTGNSTEDLSSSSKINIAYNTSSKQYIATAGTATINVNSSGAITVTFTDATFTDGSGSATIKVSGNITANK